MVYSLAFLVVLRVVGRPVALVVARAKLHLAAQILTLAAATSAIITTLVAAWFIAITWAVAWATAIALVAAWVAALVAT